MQPPSPDLKDMTGVESEIRLSNKIFIVKPSHPPPCKPPGSGPIAGGLFRRRQYRRQGSKENVLPEAGTHQEQRVTDDQQDAVTEEFYHQQSLAYEKYKQFCQTDEEKIDEQINPLNPEVSVQGNLQEQEETWLHKLQLDQEKNSDVMSKGASPKIASEKEILGDDAGCIFYQRENPLQDKQELTQEHQQYLKQEADYYHQLQNLQQNSGQFTESYQLPKVVTKKDAEYFLSKYKDEFRQQLNEEQQSDEYYRRQIIDEKYDEYYQQQKEQEAEYYQQQKLFVERQKKQSGSFLNHRQQLRQQQLRDAEFYRKQCIAIDQKYRQQNSIQEESQEKKEFSKSYQRQKILQRHESSTSSITSTEGSQHTKMLSSSQYGTGYVAKTTRQANQNKISANTSSDMTFKPVKKLNVVTDATRHRMPTVRQVLPRTNKFMDRRGMALDLTPHPVCSYNYSYYSINVRTPSLWEGIKSSSLHVRICLKSIFPPLRIQTSKYDWEVGEERVERNTILSP